MKRIVFAVLLAAAPAFADRYDSHDRRDDDRGSQGDWSGNWGEERYDWAESDGSEGGWQSWDDSGYANGETGDDRGPTLDDFRGDGELTWNGEWLETSEYGTVWRPTHVGDDWQPYLYGRWVWTRAGWAWASDEPFGWAVYHYGRWAWSPSVGWMWVPGRVWAPAWVSWRWSDGYAAWCPLGPRSVVYERPALWVVVPTRHFLEPVRHYVVPRPQRRMLPLPGRPVPRAGPAVSVIERVVGRPIRPLQIGNAPSASGARAGSGSIDFYRPRTAPIVQPRIVAPAQSGSGARVDAPRPVGPYTRPTPQVLPPRATDDAPRAAPDIDRPRSDGDHPRPQVQGPRANGEYPHPGPPADRPASVSPPPSAGVSGAAQRPPPQAPAEAPKVVTPRVAAPQQPVMAAPHAAAPKSTEEHPQGNER